MHTKAAPFDHSEKGFCMSHSQNAIFTSPTGEESLMNSNHRDSESITGEFRVTTLVDVLLPAGPSADASVWPV